MTTNLTIAKRALTTPPVVWQPSALYQGAAEGAACPSSPNAMRGGRLIQGHAFRPEGAALQDRRRNQKNQS